MNEQILEDYKKMVLIRTFETRAEAAYQQGKIGGFFHSYIGQEAVQTAVLRVFGKNNWYVTTYRCHALALLLDATPNELMAELFGKECGNAKGRGGSMHFFTKELLGGHGIVGGQIPIGTGAAFAAKYLNEEKVSITFLGDGAVAQGAFHESLNLASLWQLPALYVIENNQWGMGTHRSRALAVHEKIAEKNGVAYNMKGFTIDGMDYFSCIKGFQEVFDYMKKSHSPAIVEVISERFKGHSISDPALYRSKELLSSCLKNDSLEKLEAYLISHSLQKEVDTIKQEAKELVLSALTYAEEAAWPSPLTLEKDLFAP
jgi:pyruvate dehydrogenase E1 component alpha subunit